MFELKIGKGTKCVPEKGQRRFKTPFFIAFFISASEEIRRNVALG